MTKKIKVALAQINNSFSGQNYLPYSTALLESYVLKNSLRAEQYEFIDTIYKRIPIVEIVSRMSSAQVVGFSMYVWNEQITLESIRRLKKQNPEIFIVVGGPQVPSEPQKFLKDNPQINLLVHNEGEASFLEILDNFENINPENILGVSYLKDGEVFTNASRPRIKEIGEIPSPFLNGVFDRIVAQNPGEEWISLWETNRGCPFQCTFCDWGSATAAKVTKFGFDRLKSELDWMIKNQIKYIFVCDANFGMLQQDALIAEHVAQLRKETGYPHGFSVQNTKNATERAYNTQKIISDAGLNKGVALSMQSLDETTLKNIKRDNISLETYFELSRRFAEEKVETYSDLILGLPGETYTTYKRGIQKLLDVGQHNRIQFNNLSILPNAEMGQESYLKKHGMETIKTKVINIHGEKNVLIDDVDEYQILIVSTKSLPRADWVKARALSWGMNFFYFNKILQLPLMITSVISGVSITDCIEHLIFSSNQYKALNKLSELFIEEARSIQKGGFEYKFSEDWLGIYWPLDEYCYIELATNNMMEEFYDECQSSLLALCPPNVDSLLLAEAIKLNKELISTPHKHGEVNIELAYDLSAFWGAFKSGASQSKPSMQKTLFQVKHPIKYDSINDWCQRVVWWGNKKGAYLGQITGNQPEIAGHF